MDSDANDELEPLAKVVFVDDRAGHHEGIAFDGSDRQVHIVDGIATPLALKESASIIARIYAELDAEDCPWEDALQQDNAAFIKWLKLIRDAL